MQRRRWRWQHQQSLARIAAQAFHGTEDTALTAQIAASDPGDTLTFASAVAPASGVLTVSATGGFTYTPNENFNGNDSFTARVTDSRGHCHGDDHAGAGGRERRAVGRERRAHVASADQLAVLANDVDVDGDPLTVTLVGQAFAGTASVNAGNTVQVALPQGSRASRNSTPASPMPPA